MFVIKYFLVFEFVVNNVFFIIVVSDYSVYNFFEIYDIYLVFFFFFFDDVNFFCYVFDCMGVCWYWRNYKRMF